MPKPTFFNLPEEKRQRIVELATDEFAANLYHAASLSRIVERAGIAKGSIYQYFEDKMDLYIYIFGLAAETKLAAIQQAMAALGPSPGVFDILRAAIRAGFELARSNPKLAAIGMNFLRERDPAVRGPVLAAFMPMGEAMMDQWFRTAVETGEIAPWVEPAVARLSYTTLANTAMEHMAEGHMTLDEAARLLEGVVDVLEYGLRPRAEAGGGPEKGGRRQ
ncbi:MAG: TetR/AcrR family transcriptional regulator [Bacillota bacterium]|nr:TetR/AcrR family transcriptional regulator [Bacillota bacterium]